MKISSFLLSNGMLNIRNNIFTDFFFKTPNVGHHIVIMFVLIFERKNENFLNINKSAKINEYFFNIINLID